MKLLFELICKLTPVAFGFWIFNFFNNPKNSDYLNQLREYLK